MIEKDVSFWDLRILGGNPFSDRPLGSISPQGGQVMRYFLAIMAFFGVVFAACKHQIEVKCDAPAVVAQSGDSYGSIAAAHCSNPQEAVFRLMGINKHRAGSIPVGALIVLP